MTNPFVQRRMRPTKHAGIQGERQRELSFKECTGSDLEDKRHALYCLSDASRILRRKIRRLGSPQRWHRDQINDWAFSKVKKCTTCSFAKAILRRNTVSFSFLLDETLRLRLRLVWEISPFSHVCSHCDYFLLEDYIWNDRKGPTTVNTERRSIVAIIERSVSI